MHMTVRAAAAVTALACATAAAGTVAATAGASPLDQLAERFATYAQYADTMPDMAVRSAMSITQAVDRSAALSHAGLVQSARGYAALAAAQNPDFRSGVEAAAREMGQANLVAALTSSPANVRTVSGVDSGSEAAGEAVGLALSNLDEAARVTHAASYSLQRTAWARVRSDAAARLNAVRSATSTPLPASGFTRAAITLPQGDAAGARPVNDTVMAAAALAVLGEDTSAVTLTADREGESCLRRAHLTFRMCLAAAGFPYEQTFCLSKHALEDTAACVRAGVQ
jgi:hypothetical protein